MIRRLIEPDIDLIGATVDLDNRSDDFKHAWTCIQLRLYRYSDLLEHMNTSDHQSFELCKTLQRYLSQEEVDLARNV